MAFVLRVLRRLCAFVIQLLLTSHYSLTAFSKICSYPALNLDVGPILRRRVVAGGIDVAVFAELTLGVDATQSAVRLEPRSQSLRHNDDHLAHPAVYRDLIPPRLGQLHRNLPDPAVKVEAAERQVGQVQGGLPAPASTVRSSGISRFRLKSHFFSESPNTSGPTFQAPAAFQDVLARATALAVALVQLFVPAQVHFALDQLLAAPG